MRIISLLLLRLALGALYFYAGITKVLDPNWSAAFYLKGAKTFSSFYQWFLDPAILPTINFINEWGLLLIGLSLLFGIFVRVASVGGIMLMILYYFPTLDGVYPNAHALIVDEHVVYACALFVLASFRAGRVFGLEKWCANLPLCARFPKLRALLG